MKTIMVLGGAGFIGHHLARRLKQQGNYVIVIDEKEGCEFSDKQDFSNLYLRDDLSNPFSELAHFIDVFKPDEIYQLAADMGGAGYIFTGENDFNVMTNSALINLNLLKALERTNLMQKVKVFYSSSACIYPAENQTDPSNPNCEESSAYPANPDSEYGWEKLFSERLYLSAKRNKGLDVKIARFHNIYGPECAWNNGKEKAPAALSRKVAVVDDGGSFEIWGDGNQTRSFLYIEDCLDGIEALMQSDKTGPYNIGSEEMVTISQVIDTLTSFTDKQFTTIPIEGPVGVRGRNSHNDLVRKDIGWSPKWILENGLRRTYDWVAEQVRLDAQKY